MSDRHLQKGDVWSHVIGEKLAGCRVGIICVTPENTESPWLLFESGALAKTLGRSRVCPLLFGMLPSDLEGPLSQFQTTVFAKDDIYRLVSTLNDELGEDKLEKEVVVASFTKFWPDLEMKGAGISSIAIESENLGSVIAALQSHGFPKPAIGRVVCFDDGFESHALYQTVTEFAKERLYILGRKNRKAFDKEYWPFLRGLRERVERGFDFRCLFLSPSAPGYIVTEAHENDDFPDQLVVCLQQGVSVLRRFGIEPDSVCRVYSTHRATALLVVDNTVLFTPIEYGPSGRARALTRFRFQAVDSTTPLGQRLLANFHTTWDAASPVSTVHLSGAP
jgi:hypothetical protein